MRPIYWREQLAGQRPVHLHLQCDLLTVFVAVQYFFSVLVLFL